MQAPVSQPPVQTPAPVPARVSARRWFYLGCGSVIFLMLGVLYAWSLFAGPFEALHGLARTDTSLVFTLTLALYGLGNVAGGFTVSRRSLRFNVTVSAGLFCLGFIATSYATTIWHLYLSYGVLCGFAVGFSYSATISSLGQWFPDRPGTAAGLLLVSYGMSTLVVGTPILALIHSQGLGATFRIIAVVFSLVLILAVSLIKAPPPGMIFPQPKANRSGRPVDEPGKELRSSAMLRHTSYHRFILWQLLFVTSGFAVIGHAATSAASLGASVTMAALATSLLSLSNGLSRLAWGLIIDRLGIVRVRLPICACALAGMLTCMLAEALASPPLLSAAFLLCGTAFGGSVAYTPVFIRRMYGEMHYAANYSLYYITTVFSAIIGPTVAAHAYARYGSYFPAYMILMAFLCLGTLVAFTIRKP